MSRRRDPQHGGSLTLTDCTVSGKRLATARRRRRVQQCGTLTVTNSTISGNTARYGRRRVQWHPHPHEQHRLGQYGVRRWRRRPQRRQLSPSRTAPSRAIRLTAAVAYDDTGGTSHCSRTAPSRAIRPPTAAAWETSAAPSPSRTAPSRAIRPASAAAVCTTVRHSHSQEQHHLGQYGRLQRRRRCQRSFLSILTLSAESYLRQHRFDRSGGVQLYESLR